MDDVAEDYLAPNYMANVPVKMTYARATEEYRKQLNSEITQQFMTTDAKGKRRMDTSHDHPTT